MKTKKTRFLNKVITAYLTKYPPDKLYYYGQVPEMKDKKDYTSNN